MLYRDATHGPWCGAKTIPTRCKYCGQEVFYFTCNCGSKVFFDSLGCPWPEHTCWQYLEVQYGKEFVERAMEVQMKLSSASAADYSIDPGYASAVRQRHEAPKAPPRRIVRCEPAEGQTVQDVGVVREVIQQMDVFKKLGVPDGSSIGIQLLGPLGCDRFGQLTIHTGDLTCEDSNSYTCFVRCERLRALKPIRGDVVSFELGALMLPGREAVWLCEGLDFPLFDTSGET